MASKGVFGQFNAGYQEEVSLYRSGSAAGGVWLRIEQHVTEADKLKTGLNGEPCLKLGEAAAHLSPAQAVVLRAMLDSYLSEADDE